MDVEKKEFKYEDLKIKITCSAGIGSYPEVCSENPTLQALLNEVDSALYYAKRHGPLVHPLAPYFFCRKLRRHLLAAPLEGGQFSCNLLLGQLRPQVL